ncbi:glutathione S-transferase [Sphingomonas sp. Leaf412]|uniref:glutathione S-transferase family protein n=1 Tax=Sphingomonas sp. Leaf412 TaxID=1736370 RepID=UPI0006F351B0|nr:glutathione S-transferase family protein [Sphingomonas sp. Leaf412]KQT34647.1 glutathione S-transferase [Sphingomonas sp. Leaf412]
MTLTFYTHPMSRGRIARWMLEESGAPYDTVLIDWDDKPAALLAANPLGKVPTIVHDGHVVSEAAAICAYMAEAFPDAGLAPTAAERAAYHRWMFFTAGPLESAMMDKALGVDVPADRRMMVGYGSFAEAVDTLEQALSGTAYVAGDRFTAADVYVGSAVGWFTQFGMLEKRAAFTDYLARLWDRPAWVRARAIDDALMPTKA